MDSIAQSCYTLPAAVTTPLLYLNHLADLDWLIALEFGRVDDGQPPTHWRGLSESFGWLEPDGQCAGFKIVGFSKFDVEDPEVGEVWDGPRFTAPVLGLTHVNAGEIIIAGRALFAGRSSVNRHYFGEAMDREGEDALTFWLACLQAGDAMAHYGLGYTLFELGRHREAYRHLRHYTEISPSGSWNWCWYGRAAEALGLKQEARHAYEIAIELADDGGEATDAPELLEQLDA
jgi:tetratricopeptide (TPR) repeat protein